MARLVRMVPACIVVLSCFTANDVIAQPLSTLDPWQFAALSESKPFQRGWWYFQQRAYPLDDIPTGARQRALEQIERHKAAHPRTSQAIGTWTNIGPAPITTGFSSPTQSYSGRVTAVAVDPGNPSHWLIGAAQGGVWETRDAGTTWAPKTDGQASLAMGAIAFAPSNPSVIYAGTGEGNFTIDTVGAGLLKSADGGATWTLFAAPTFAQRTFNDLKVHPANPNILLAATAQGLAGRLATSVPGALPVGVFKSADGGATWSRTLTGQATALAVDPTNFNNLYAGIGAPLGDAVNALYRSTDGGGTWAQIPGPWNSLAGGVGRIAFATAPTNSNVLYAGISRGTAYPTTLLGLFRTDNAWASTPTWIQIPNGATGAQGYCGDQCSYNQALAVDPGDPNTLYAGGRPTAWRCTNCGTSPTWTNIGARIHGDHHALVWVGGRLISANDGGVWSTTDGGDSWTNHNTNLSITQFYAGSLHPTDPNFALGGSQDNGDVKWIGSGAWPRLRGSDGNDSAISSNQPNTNWAISGYVTGPLTIARTTNGGTSFIAADGGIDKTNAPNVARLKKCPANDDVFLTGTDTLWRANNFFSAPSPSWAVNGPKMNASISAIAFAGSDGTCSTYAFGTTWSTSGEQQLRLTFNGGGTWVDLDPGKVLPQRPITDLAFDPTNANTLYVTLSGFDESRPGHPGHLFKTTNALAPSPSWVNVSPPVNLPHNTVAVDPSNPSAVYIGTDIGVWASADGGATWMHMGPETGMPNVAVFDLKINPTTRRIVAYTYGRGAFTLTPQLGLSAIVNQPTFAVGQTLIVGGGVTNPGLPGTADFYVGLLRPDGAIQFFTSTGIVVGNSADLTSFQPIASGVPLATPFSVTQPDFYSHQWTAGELRGNYVFFLAVVKAGALADGMVTSDEIFGLATASFAFP